MNAIIGLHNDLLNYNDNSIKLIAKYYQLNGTPNDLRWLIAIKHYSKKGQMYEGIMDQEPILTSMAKNMTVKEVLDYAQTNKLTRKIRDSMLRNSIVKKSDIDKALHKLMFTSKLTKNDIDIFYALFKNNNITLKQKKIIGLFGLFQGFIKYNDLDKALEVADFVGKHKIDIIRIENNPSFDLQFLSNFPKLWSVEINSSTVTGSFSELSPNVTYLSLIKSTIEDFSGLSRLTNLRYLYLTGTNIKDVTPLLGLEKLEVLNIQKTPITEESKQIIKNHLPKTKIDPYNLI